MKKRALSDILLRGANNFDLIRLVAALSVMLGHSYGMHNPTGNHDFIKEILKTDYPGSLAVYAFFLISGILITQSFDRLKNPVHFFALRVARLWPGLVVNVLVTVFLIGPFFTSKATIVEYLLDGATLQYLRVNILHIGTSESYIASIFTHNVVPSGANFPLWTLSVEAQCYAIVFVLGCLGVIHAKRLILPIMIVLLAAFLAISSYESHWPFTILFFHKFADYSFYPVPFFFLGIACYVLRNSLTLNWKVAAALCIAAALLHRTVLAVPTFGIALAYGVLCLSSSEIIRRFNPKHDYSYGIYIYGFVCQQMTAAMWPTMNSYAGLLISASMAIAFAALSWHFVEKPVLDRVRSYIRPQDGKQIETAQAKEYRSTRLVA